MAPPTALASPPAVPVAAVSPRDESLGLTTQTPSSQPSNLIPTSPATGFASILLDPTFPAFHAVSACHPPEDGESNDETLDLINGLKSLAASVIAGDTSHPESITATQATALNVIFGRLAALAMNNTSSRYFDSFMRLSLRAQHQCQQTLHKLPAYRHSSKNRTAVVAHQLNVAHQQIVHNAPPPAPAPPSPPTPQSEAQT
jgi:hypothetical protein